MAKPAPDDNYRQSYLPFVNVEQFRAKAKSLLPWSVYAFYSTGATDEVTLKENQRAFTRLLFKWRCLRGVSGVNLQTTVQGDTIGSPVCVAPASLQGLAHPGGEVSMARACAASNTLMTLSTMSSCSLEDVAECAADSPSPKWFQLYTLTDREITRRLVQRAEKSGYKALVMTIDLPRVGIRYVGDQAFKFPPFASLPNFSDLHRDPSTKVSSSSISSRSAPDKPLEIVLDRIITWDDVAWLKSITKLPIIVKGVMNAEDATEALRRGVSGIWVSNHGARQLDSTAATIEVLPEVVHAINGRVEVYVDGGVRNGGDVLKALALGARAVFVGRPALWGLACNGEAGVCQVLELLNKELELSMALCGCPSVHDIPESIVVPAAKYRSNL
eukprot:scpid46288/ scgid35401/ Hydroxyacid oxidase 1; Glycolate oxidase